MAAKPSTLPEWASGGAAAVTEPLLAEKQLGWQVAERPPAQWWNWWMKLVWQWTIWLKEFEDTAHSWGAAQTFDASSIFNAGVTFADTVWVTGDSTFEGMVEHRDLLYLNPPDAFTESIYGPSVAAGRRLILRWQVQASPTVYVRLYAAPPRAGALNGFGAGLEATYNASWNGTVWTRDSTSYMAGRVALGQGVMVYQQFTGGSDASWIPQMQVGGQDAGVGVVGVGYGGGPRDMLLFNASGQIFVGTEQAQNAWTNLVLSANIAAVGGGFSVPRFLRDSNGFAHLTGLAQATTTITSTTQIATLDASCRPDSFIRVDLGNVGAATGCWLRLDPAGPVTLNFSSGSVSPGAQIPFDAVRFKAV
jgi:hypothetical protein